MAQTMPAESRRLMSCGDGCLRGERVRRRWSAVPVERNRVHDQGVGDHVEVLAMVANRVRSTQPEGVIEGLVDALRVVAPPVQPDEVGINRRDGSHVSRRD